ncbi:hypothetical protein BSKO_06568 [Bryopsis sp. KO-2023]|nr:hypothetical protein BSKO_06568 [Bryopsis sp. KO-2023]
MCFFLARDQKFKSVHSPRASTMFDHLKLAAPHKREMDIDTVNEVLVALARIERKLDAVTSRMSSIEEKAIEVSRDMAVIKVETENARGARKYLHEQIGTIDGVIFSVKRAGS